MATKTQKPPRPADQPRNRDARTPATPIKLPRHSWGGVFKRTITEFRDDNLTDLAAALTYYGILAIFPALIALVSILGLIGHSATQPLINNLDKVAPRIRLDRPGRIGRGGGVGDRVGCVCSVRGELRVVQQDLRHTRRGGDLPRVAVAVEHRDPARRGVQRGDRARPPDRAWASPR